MHSPETKASIVLVNKDFVPEQEIKATLIKVDNAYESYIANQRDMLEKYCEKQGWEVVAVYQDDGFTGLNMERPDLQRMLRAIERRQINLVITKDLSRLGRNYLQTGHLIEDLFPRNGVRYIARNDGIDTLRDNNDIAPVSYTHLDVYKRQAAHRAGNLKKVSCFFSAKMRW